LGAELVCEFRHAGADKAAFAGDTWLE